MRFALSMVFAVGLLLSRPAAAVPAEWCRNSPFSAWDANHHLAYKNLPPEALDAASKRQWPVVVVELRLWLQTYVADSALSRAEFQPLFDALAVSETMSAVPWTAWTGRVRNGVMSYDLGVLRPGLFIDLPCSQNTTAAVAIAHFADTLATSFLGDFAVRLDEATKRVQKSYELHFTRLKSGLPMWPQEYWANGYGANIDPKRPPHDWQWIFLRPEALAAFKFDGSENSQVDVAVGIEPFGFVRYLDAEKSDFKKWWGVSALVAVTNDNGVGYGGTFRYGKYLVGLAHHKKNYTTMLYLGVDLYSTLLKEEAASSASTLAERVRTRINERGVTPGAR